MLGIDTVTVYKKQSDGTFARHVVRGVQWSDHSELVNSNGRVSTVRRTTITFFEGTYEKLDLQNYTEEDAVFYGEIPVAVVDGRISSLLKSHPISGLIESVNDNSNKRHLKNIKVVLSR